MRWKGREESANVEDRRGAPQVAPIALGGGLLGLIIVVVMMLMGVDPAIIMKLIEGSGGGSIPTQQEPGGTVIDPADDEAGSFVKVVLKDTEDVWNRLFAEQNLVYQEPTLVLFSRATQSACGFASSATGPFYCPADNKVYLDTTFFDELSQRFGAEGDFAQAYVIAHEVAHHVQNLLGISERVQRQRARVSQEEYNRLSVRLELQADYLAGVWAHYAQRMQLLEEGDIEEAIRAASAIGDDRLQKQTQGYVVPDSFTHGTSEQRVRWFTKGFRSGDMKGGDTFNVPYHRL